MEKAIVIQAVNTLERAIKIEILLSGDSNNQFCSEVRELLRAMCQKNDMENDILNEFETAIQKAEEAAEIPDAEIRLINAEYLMDAVLDLCESAGPKETLKHIKTMLDVLQLRS